MRFPTITLTILLPPLLTITSALPLTSTDWTTTQWDIIVVGSGPAGIITASRLSETGKKTLLLEAGGPSYGVTGGTQRPDWLAGTNLSRVDVPGLYKSVFSDPGNLTCGNTVNAYIGCTIGGSSAINAGLFFQPPASDFDLYFPDGWKRKDMGGAIRRLKRTQASVGITSSDRKRYLQSGYHAARKWLVNGAGFKEVRINAKADDKTKVFGHPIFDYIGGQRGGPAVTYLQPALKRPNFHLQSNVPVLRVVRSGDVATGVEAYVDGTLTIISLSPTGRVILSGGALQSPQLLMMSGIGDPAVLARLAAANKLAPLVTQPSEWINNTAVGAGLFDNPNTFIEFSSPDVQSYVYSYSDPVPADAAAYVANRSGPYTFASETSVFWDTIEHDDGSITGLQGTIDSSGYGDYTSNNTITLNIYGTSGLLSSGHVVLDSNFIPGPSSDVYYSNPRDAADIATFIHSLFRALPSSTLTPLNIPANASYADILSYITTPSAYAKGMVNHWSSSCRFGSCVDKEKVAVVGMRNLHVVDASVVPPLTVNPQMGVMILAERAAELIKKLL